MVNLSEHLIPGTYEWTINYLIDRMDLSLFEEKYNNDEKGAAAFTSTVTVPGIRPYNRSNVRDKRL